MPRLRVRLFAALVAFCAVAAAALFACSQTPTSVPLRTFERAQKMAVVCLRLYDDAGRPQTPVPQPQEACAPVPNGVDGSDFQDQLFALVTQTARGEVAVVDLSAGALVDQTRAIPGINFLPVGALPTDIVAAPDGAMTFVASAEVNKFAIYGIPSRRIIGDVAGFPPDPDGKATLASWPVCGLPQRPGALAVVKRRGAPASPSAPDAGADAGSDAGADAGAPPAAPSDVPDYEIVAVLPGDRRSPAKIVVIDPRPFLRGAHVDATEGPAIAPGSLAPCPVTAAVELAGGEALPATFSPGPAWSDGIEWDAAAPAPAPTPDGGADGGAGGAPATGAWQPPTCGATDAGPAALPLDLPPLEAPHPIAAVADGTIVYVADDQVPVIHVLDLSAPGRVSELPPLLATSLAEPGRAVSVAALAVSPPTRKYEKFLYAVDRDQGSIIVYDVTDPKNGPREPLSRPHPELNPFQPPDRIAFASPVVAVAFARHDFPLARINGAPITNAKTGLLCNPNPNLDGDPARDLGFYYRASSTDPDVGLGPARLRGIFAFATLANGQVVAIDVDDWDAPCRRPVLLSPSGSVVAQSSLAVPQPPPAGPDDLDPYHAPESTVDAVTDEQFVPVSAPHRLRSAQLLSDNTSTGKHVPYLSGLPTVDQGGVPLPLTGEGSEGTPRLRPTGSADEAAGEIGVRFAFEVPGVHVDQDWTVTYEGEIPGFDGVSATIDTEDGYQSLVLRQPSAGFCAHGIEDLAMGQARAAAITAELGASAPADLASRVADYVQITDEILGPDDPYWSLADDPGACWDPRLPPGRARHDACINAYGGAGDQSKERDFPILEAYDDHLVIGRFYAPPDAPRIVVGKRPDNNSAAYLKLMRCCFHDQVHFRVRASNEWVTLGSQYGFLSHVAVDSGGRCVPSCEPRLSLMNARAPALPPGVTAPERDSVLAMRNPVFSFFVTNGQEDGVEAVPQRDTVYAFSTRGQFEALFVNLASTTSSVNPQSMSYVETLGQIAVIDGASQGLVLIDLGGVAIARAPYF